MINVDCEECGNRFEVADSLAGGLTNCPACRRATPVRGLHDPYYRLVQVAMAAGWVLVTTVGWFVGGWIGALSLGVGLAIILGLVYISM